MSFGGSFTKNPGSMIGAPSSAQPAAQSPFGANSFQGLSGYVAPPAPQSGGGQFGNLAGINTSVTPSSVYTPQQTQQQVNNQIALGQQAADPRFAMKGFTRPGMSQDQGTFAAALPQIGQSLFQGQSAAAQTPLNDNLANQQNLLAGQVSQSNEALGLGNALSTTQANNTALRNSQIYPLLGQFAQMMM